MQSFQNLKRFLRLEYHLRQLPDYRVLLLLSTPYAIASLFAQLEGVHVGKQVSLVALVAILQYLVLIKIISLDRIKHS